MKIAKFAEENYYRFCNLEGNQFIASEFALIIILKLIKRFKVRSVLELGVGIGSISDTVLRVSDLEKLNLKYVGTEANKYCRDALKTNVLDYEKISLYNNLNEIDQNNSFDLIIVDGQDQALINILNYCKKNTIIFIEGDRSPQRKLIMALFPNSVFVNKISLRKNKNYAHGSCSPLHYVGGGQIIFVNPNFKTKVYWLLEKVNTYFIRKIRNKKIRMDETSY